MSFPQAEIVCHNGRLVTAAQAQVPVFHPALYGAYGIYESIQVASGVIFHLEEHLARLAGSAAILEMTLPHDRAQIASWIPALLAASQLQSCLLRLFVLGANGGAEGDSFIWAQSLPIYPAQFYSEGAGAVTFEGERALPQAKSLNTLVNFLARRQAQRQGEHEGLLQSRGTIKEGSSSNLFVVRDGRLLTPPPEEVLAGVTADIVLALAAREGIEVVAAPLAESEICAWDEAFLTSTSRHIMPLVRINGQPIGDGRPGPITQHLSRCFEGNFQAAIAAQTPADG
ncbi:MAG: aminotransferase class IV [Anaerolineae bacterium]|uniref:aminotransferase class IV n=1 Tax=Candidatus Amarolinea dominans TaxID=3140696 RepID=UPI001D2F0A9B|nr:aminotransferase class IV [Anaerolineae bacterium]MBK9229635.1 aminotransferase class IV [Anaerolineae bacterium]